ncbi:glycosyltransferase family 2 protein [Cellulomonas sp. 73-92]|uniref:glycosyltransferase family 2 protein n=1 Tax=Cellulomonas sp. 73-92 TaxID=1895740 RepID=UPI000A9FFB5A
MPRPFRALGVERDTSVPASGQAPDEATRPADAAAEPDHGADEVAEAADEEALRAEGSSSVPSVGGTRAAASGAPSSSDAESAPAGPAAPGASPAPAGPSAPRSSRDRARVAAIIPAKDEARRIAATVRAVRAIPGVDLILVVDDGSEDDTQHAAREAGAVVVRHSHNRGRAAALETGAAVVAMRDVPGRPPRSLLLLAADLAEAAVNVAPLIPPIFAGTADMTVALLPPAPTGRGMVVGAARRAIAQLTGWTPDAPLSPLRCLTRAAFEAATPLAHGAGIEPAMTIDLLRRGFRVLEVPIELRHHPAGGALRNQVRRVAGARDVELAINARRMGAAADAVRDRLAPPARRGR